MSNYTISRRTGLGYVYYKVPDGSPKIKIKSLTTGSAQTMSDIYGRKINRQVEISRPEYFAENLKKRDDGIIKILDIWKVPYTRDNSFGNKQVALTIDQINNATMPRGTAVAPVEQIADHARPLDYFEDIPVSDVVVTNASGNEVPLQTVLSDPTAQVVVTDSIIEPTTSKKGLYVGLGVIAVIAAVALSSTKTKKSK